MTQILVASSLFQAMSLAAGIKSGALGDSDRRLMVIAHDVEIPEVSDPITDSPAFGAIAPLIDEVVLWNDIIAPRHPGGWCPREDEAAVIGRLLARLWGITPAKISQLVVQSPAVSPAQAFSTIFPDAPITVYSEGLMSYGPTRSRLPQSMYERITELIHVDLLPGISPLMLSEYDVPSRVIPLDAFAATLQMVAEASAEELASCTAPITAVFLGQYLAALGILSDFEELSLHISMLREIASVGHQQVAFKPHPQAPPGSTARLLAQARDLGVSLTILGPELPAEIWLEKLRPELVLGCFSTALVTGRQLYGLNTRRIGTELVLERLTPYQNSNRLPLVVVDALIPGPEGPAESPLEFPLGELLATVGYSMQNTSNPKLRRRSVDFLQQYLSPQIAHYFEPARLAKQGLPGGSPAQRRLRGSTRIRRILRALSRRINWFRRAVPK